MITLDQKNKIASQSEMYFAESNSLAEGATNNQNYFWNSLFDYLDEISLGKEEDSERLNEEEFGYLLYLIQRVGSINSELAFLKQKQAVGPFTEVDQEYSKELKSKIEFTEDALKKAKEDFDAYLNSLTLPDQTNPKDESVEG